MRSQEENKKYLGDDQPVEEVTWYGAQAYCLWLTLLDLAVKQGSENIALQNAGTFYRLPHEKEWFWAAAGREADGSLREYPWRKKFGKPTPKLANYDGNVDATTPVGRYPDGATPEGLLDMAGNVWEWQANFYSEKSSARLLHGGSWDTNVNGLRCSARNNNHPDNQWNNNVGFRVAFSESNSKDSDQMPLNPRIFGLLFEYDMRFFLPGQVRISG